MKPFALLKRTFYEAPALVVFNLFAIVASLAMLLTPDSVIGSSPVFVTWPSVVGNWLWPIFFGLGGAITLRGLALHRPSGQAAGLILLSSAMFIYAIALVTFLEGDFGGSWTDSFVVLTVFVGSATSLTIQAYRLVKTGEQVASDSLQGPRDEDD